MKAWPLILAASLLANAGLVATVTLHRSQGIDLSAPFSIRTHPAAGGGAAVAATAGDLAAAFGNDDPAVLRDFLRAAGLPDDIVRVLVIKRIDKKYEARRKALQPQSGFGADKDKFWRQARPTRISPDQRRELTKLGQDERDEIERVLGPDPNSKAAPQLGFLSEAKRRQLEQIQQDYQDMIGDVYGEAQGFMTATDREKIKLLQQEQQKDIAALLSPEELQAYQMRTSQTANQLRWQMSHFDASEDEFRKIFTLQKAFDDQYNYMNGPQGPDFWAQRNKAEEQLQAQLKDALGADRYAAYQRSQSNDYQMLQAATARFNLPADTADKVYALRDNVVADSKQIADDSSLTTAQKKQALAALAANINGQVRTALGDEAADAFFANNGMGWLKSLNQGQAIQNISGGGWSSGGVF